MRAMTHFTETQRFGQGWLRVLVIAVAAPFWYGAWRQLVRGVPWGTNPAPDAVLGGAWLLAGIGVPALFLFARLDTEVRDDGIRVRFRPFHLRPREWPWGTIATVEARRYSPLREYGGWGVRIGRRGIAYNVSGRDGIEITFRAGHRVLLGTRDPDGFMRAAQRVAPATLLTR